MRFLRWLLLCVGLGFGLFCLVQFQPASAATGTFKQINFQGKVVNKTTGTNIANNSYTFVFTIYDAASGGSTLWTETKSVTVTNGIFQTLLGSDTALPASIDFNTDNIYLGINFNSDGEMSPRVRFAAVPQAFNAQKVAGLTVTDTTGTLTIPNGATIAFAGAYTTTFTSTNTTTVTLPTSGTLATLAGTEELTNKTIGSTGLVFSGASTDIDAATGQGLTFQGRAASSFDTTSGNLSFQIAGTGTTAVVQIGAGGAGGTTPDYLALDVKSDTGDPANGAEGYMYYNTADNKFRCYQNSGWTDCIGVGGPGSSNWTDGSGIIYPNNATLDMFIGGLATSSAKFAFINVNSGTPTASIAGNLALAAPTGADPATNLNVYNGGSYNIQTSVGGDVGLTERLTILNNGNVGIGTTAPVQKLQVIGNISLQNGEYIDNSSDGHIKLLSNNYSKDLDFYVDDSYAYIKSNNSSVILMQNIVGANEFTMNSLSGSGLSAAGTDLILHNQDNVSGNVIIKPGWADGSTGQFQIYDDFDNTNVFTVDLTGKTYIGGNVGIGSTAPSQMLDVTGAIRLGAADADNILNTTVGGGAPSGVLYWGNRTICDSTGNCGGGSSNWTLGAGFVHPNNPSVDLFIGGTASASAKFAFLNVNSGIPTASIAGNLALAAPTGADPATNLNVYNGGSYNIQTSVGGDVGLVSRLYVANNGNVGIGTTAPAGKFNVVDNSNTAASFSLTNNTATTIGNGANTLGVIDLQSTSLTTGNFLNIELNALTTGKGINLTSTSTTFSTGNLASLDWSPSGSTEIYATGDLLKLNVGQYGNIGKILGIYNNASEVFSVAQSQITSAVPHQFTQSGDVSIANDLVFTNLTSGNILSDGPLAIAVGESWNNDPLTLNTYGAGNLVANLGSTGKFQLTSADPSILLDSKTTTDTDFWLGIQEDAGGDDDDLFSIGDGLTPGTNTFFSITTAGNVGIGSTTPSQKLDVVGAIRLGAADADNVLNTTVGSSAPSGYLYWGDRTLCDSTGNCGGGSSNWTLGAGFIHPNNPSVDLFIGGTASASAKFAFLNVNSGIPTASIAGNLALAAPTGADPATGLYVYNGGAFSIKTSVGGDVGLTDRLTILNNGNVGIGTTAPSAKLSVGGASSVISNASGNLTITPAANLLISSGSVGIGTTNPSEVLHVVGSARFTAVGSATQANDLRITSDGTLTTNTSDVTMKVNVTNLETNTLDKIMQLNPVSFNWVDNAEGSKDIGFIAQEVNKIFPEITFINPTDGKMGVNYSRLPAILTKAIQEQQGEIILQRDVLATLTASLDKLSLEVKQADLANIQGTIASLTNTVSQVAFLTNRLDSLEYLLLNASGSGNLDTGMWQWLDKNLVASSSGLALRNKLYLESSDSAELANAGLLTIETSATEGASIQTTDVPLKLQKDALSQLEFMGGKLVIDTSGNLTVTESITAKEVRTNKLKLIGENSGEPGAVLAASTGKVEIEAGKTSVTVKTSALTDQSLIFVSAENIPTAVAAKKTDNETIEIFISTPLSEILKVSWWIIN